MKLASTGKQSPETAALVRELVKDLLVSKCCRNVLCFNSNRGKILFALETFADRHFVRLRFCGRMVNWKLRSSPADYTKSSTHHLNLTLCLS